MGHLALHEAEGERGAGYVIRDHDGKLMLAASFSLFDISVPLAEMIGAWNAIKATVMRLGTSKLWVEGNTLGITRVIEQGTKVDGYAANLLGDIKSWLRMLDMYNVTHIYREGNIPTDSMAVGDSKGI